MIVVTTPTGNIGSEVVRRLLDAGEAVRVIARDPARLAPEVRDRVEIVSGTHEDESVLNAALPGADGLFWVVPPTFKPGDATEYYVRFGRVGARAAAAHGVHRVVGVSAIGRHSSLPTGLAGAALASDDEFAHAGVAYRALWCPSFMDNMLMQIEPLRRQGAFFLPEPADRKMPRVATRDIGAIGAQLLLDRSWSGQGGVAVLGPEDITLNDMAETMSDILGTPIRYQSVPREDYKAHMMKLGASEGFAESLVVMHEAKAQGLDESEPRTLESTTPTTFRQWCEGVLKPAFR